MTEPDPLPEIAELTRRIEELEEAVHLLTLSVEFHRQEPYATALLRHQIVGESATLVGLVLNAVLGRALGESVSTQRPRRDVMSSPVLDAAYVDEPVTRPQAVALLAQIVGSEEGAAEILDAHRARGLGLDGHAALT